MKQILIIDREFGSGGSTIAKMLAERLNWKLFDDQLSEEIARLANIPVHICKKREERKDPFLHHLINLIWRGSFDRNLPSPDTQILDTDCLVSIIERVIKQAAESRPCVIVGRGAPYFLRERKDIFPVFLYASRDLRFHRVLKRVNDNQHEAIRLVDTQDEERKKFVKHYFGHEWPNRQLFHAMLNTAVGDENTADAILQLINAANHREEASKS
jgi:cytidylate kinase